jgi:hypothetical protein
MAGQWPGPQVQFREVCLSTFTRKARCARRLLEGGGSHAFERISRIPKGAVVRSFVRIAVTGLVAVASILSITMATVETARATEPSAPPESSDIADDPPGEEIPAPPPPADAADPPSLPRPSPGEVSPNATCDGRRCTHRWYSSGGEVTDSGVVLLYGGDYYLYACNWNNDDISIGVQVDPSDGRWAYYTRGDATRGEADTRCAADYTETRTIRKIRFVAVDRNGRAVGTPTAWIAPPGGTGPP